MAGAGAWAGLRSGRGILQPDLGAGPLASYSMRAPCKSASRPVGGTVVTVNQVVQICPRRSRSGQAAHWCIVRQTACHLPADFPKTGTRAEPRMCCECGGRVRGDAVVQASGQAQINKGSPKGRLLSWIVLHFMPYYFSLILSKMPAFLYRARAADNAIGNREQSWHQCQNGRQVSGYFLADIWRLRQRGAGSGLSRSGHRPAGCVLCPSA